MLYGVGLRSFQHSLKTSIRQRAPIALQHPFRVTSRSLPARASILSRLSPIRLNATLPHKVPPSLSNWLFGCSALVFSIIVIGGLTRLTESGLSITEWQPITGILPPLSEEEWQHEWEKYRSSPEGMMINSKIDMSEFKRIFYMEWGHRIAGRALGVAFVLPATYYMTRYRLPRTLKAKLFALGAGIGFQGVLGWYMVKSGLDQQIIINNDVPRVSQYRLAAHLSAALALYIGMVSTAIDLRRTASGTGPASVSALRFRTLSLIGLGMVFTTAVSGAFVAGLDAGLVYNEFPTMGGRLIPPSSELLDSRYAQSSTDRIWRNALENPVTAQFDHRVMALCTFGVVISIPLLARRVSVSQATRRWANAVGAAAIAQVSLGVSTLLYLVPVPLAAAHQAGSVILLTCLLGLVGTLRRPAHASQLSRRLLSH